MTEVPPYASTLATKRKDPPPVRGRAVLRASIEGYLAHKKQPSPRTLQ